MSQVSEKIDMRVKKSEINMSDCAILYVLAMNTRQLLLACFIAYL
jgi:hypothetical protein